MYSCPRAAAHCFASVIFQSSIFAKLSIGLFTLACFFGQSALAGSANVTGAGLGGSWNWSTTANWTGGIAPGTTAGDVVGLSGNFTSNTAVTMDGTSRTLGTLNIGDTASTYRIVTVDSTGGATLTFDNGGSNAQLNSSVGNALNSAAVIVSAPILLNSSLDITNSSTAASLLTLSTSGITAGTSGTKTISNLGNGTAGVTISGVIGNGSGTVAVTQNSANTLTLSGVNTYTGGTTVSAGTLSVGGTATASGTTITGSATGTGNVTFASGTALSNVSTSTWFVPTITLAGAGSTLNLTGTNRLIVSYNILELGDAGRTGVTTINVNGVSKAVTGGNTLAAESTGQWGWEVATTVATGGTTTIQNGMLDLQTTAFSGANYGMHFIRATNFTNADLTIGNNVILGANGSSALGTSATSSPNVTINASGILNMLGSSKSVKSLAGSGSIFNSMVTTNTNNSTLNIIGTTGSTTFSGVIADGPGTGALSVTKNGASTQILSGTNTYSGTTTLGAGTLVARNAQALGTGALSMTSGATAPILDLQNYSTATNTTITGTANASILVNATTSAASASYTLGTLAMPAATLAVSRGANVTTTGNLTFGSTTLSANTAVFDTGSGINLTLGAVGGAFNFTKQGAGQLTLGTTSNRGTSAGGTTLTAGTLRLETANALNSATTTPVLNLNGGKLSLGLDLGAQIGGAGSIVVGGTATIEVDRAAPGAGVTDSVNQISLGAQTLNVTAGSNVTSGTAGLNLTTSTGSFTLTADGAILDVGSGVAVASTGSIAGNFSFTKQGAGSLAFNAGSSRSSGQTTLTAGTLKLGATAALGTSASTLALNGGTLNLATDTSITAYGTIIGGDVIIQSDKATASSPGITHTLGALSIGANTLTLSAGSNVSSGTAGLTFGATTLTGASNFSLDTGTILTLGAITDGGNRLTLTGSGNFAQSAAWASGTAGGLTLGVSGGTTYSGAATLDRANTFTGGVTLNSGTLNINLNGTAGTSGPLGNGGTFTINGGTLDNTSGSARVLGNVTPTTINGNFAFTGTGDLSLGTGATTLGTAAGTSRTITANAGILSLAGVIANGSTTNSITKEGNGILSFLGVNAFTGGLVVNAGTIRSTGNPTGGSGTITGGQFGTTTLTMANGTGITWNTGLTIANTQTILNGNITLGSGSSGRLTWDAGAFVLGGNARTITVAATDTLANAVNVLGSATVNAVRWNIGTPAVPLSLDSGSTLKWVSSGTGSSWSGLGLLDVVTFNGNSTLAVGSNVLMTFTSSNRLTNGTGTARLNVEQGGIVSLSNQTASQSQTVYSLSDGGGTGGIVTNLATTAGTATLTISNGDSKTFSGTIVDGADAGTGLSGIVGVLAVTKSGSGTQTLTGANTYTGTTTVTAGALQVGNAGVGQTGSGAVTVASGGTILGTGTVRGNTLDLQNGSTLRPGDGMADSSLGTLTFAPASASGSTSNLQGSIILGISTPTITDATFGGNALGSAGYNAWVAAIAGTGSHDRLVFGNPTTGPGYNLNFLTTTGSLQVVGSSFTPAMGQAFNLLDWSNLVTTNFSGFTFNSSYLTGNGDEGADLDLPNISSSGLRWDFSRFTTSGVIVVVPEPSRALLIIFGLAGLMLRRRRF